MADATSLNKVAPALYVTAGGGANSGYFVRGVGNFTNNGYTSPAIAFNIDGVYIGRPSSTIAWFLDLDRVIVFTGDTGASKNVEQLAKGADLLVSEMMDVDFTLANLKRNNSKRKQPVLEKALDGVYQHLKEHHVTAKQVGEMANNAQVKSVVVTHFMAKEDSQLLKAYTAEIAKTFSGKVVIAEDLQRF